MNNLEDHITEEELKALENLWVPIGDGLKLLTTSGAIPIELMPLVQHTPRLIRDLRRERAEYEVKSNTFQWALNDLKDVKAQLQKAWPDGDMNAATLSCLVLELRRERDEAKATLKCYTEGTPVDLEQPYGWAIPIVDGRQFIGHRSKNRMDDLYVGADKAFPLYGLKKPEVKP